MPLLKKYELLIKEEIDRILINMEIQSIDELIDKIKCISNGYIKYCLRDQNIQKSQLICLTDKAFSNERINNNKVELTKSDVHNILTCLY